MEPGPVSPSRWPAPWGSADHLTCLEGLHPVSALHAGALEGPPLRRQLVPSLRLSPASAPQSRRKGFGSCRHSCPRWSLPSVWARGGLLLPWWLGGGGGEVMPVAVSGSPEFPSHCQLLWVNRPGRPLTLPTSWPGPGVRACLCTQGREVGRPPLAIPLVPYPSVPFTGCLLCTKPTTPSFNPFHFLWVL